MGEVLQAGMATLSDLPLVREVRGAGLLGCVECGDGQNLERDYQLGLEIDRRCQARGLLVRPIVNLCVVSPPLTITPEQIDFMVSVLRDSILETAQARG